MDLNSDDKDFAKHIHGLETLSSINDHIKEAFGLSDEDAEKVFNGYEDDDYVIPPLKDMLVESGLIRYNG